MSQIDGTLIADGAMMNWDGGRYPDNTIKSLFWITDSRTSSPKLTNRLIINGRLLTHNTR
ncbi:MAG: hypothetical protein WCK88_03335 [bacterium]